MLGVEGRGALGQHGAFAVAVVALVGLIKFPVAAVDVFQFLGAYFVPLDQPGGQFWRGGPRLLLCLVLAPAFLGQNAALLVVGLLDEFPAENVVFEVHALRLVGRLDVLILGRLAGVPGAGRAMLRQEGFKAVVVGDFPV